MENRPFHLKSIIKKPFGFFKYLTPNTFLRKARLSRKLYYYTIVGLMLLAGGTTVLIQTLFPKGVEAAWFNSNWAYRKAINITAHTSAEKNVYIKLNGGSGVQVDVGTYTGTGAASYSPTVSLGFQPTFVLIKGENSSPGVFATDTMGTNKSKELTGNTAPISNGVLSLDATGFTVGNATGVNQSGDKYYYIAIADSTGTNFKTFSYIGTGSAHTESVCPGFTPSLVILGQDTNGVSETAPLFRASHTGSGSNQFNGSESTTRITGFTSGGFTVGTSTSANESGKTYFGICAKAAANFMATKLYAGNGLDNQSVTGIGFQPDFTVTKKLDTSDSSGIRFKDEVGDSSLTANSTFAADRIQAFESDGFQVGTNICCNSNTSTYNSFSFKESTAGSGPAIDTSDTTKFQADCGDLRFTDAAGNILPYYIVSGCGTSNTVVHIFMEDFPAGEQTVYMYYGNPAAANGFSSSDFSTQASAYTVGSLGSEEVGAAPVAYWKFDEGSGTVAKDSSSFGYNGTLTGSTLPAWKADQCVSQKCLFFNGITSNVSVSGTVPGVKSIAFWVNPSASSTGELMALNASVHIRSTNGTITAPGSTSPTIYVNGVQNGTITANTWNYVTVTTNTAISASAITLGKAPLGVLKGYLDEVKFYNYVRSAAQVKVGYTSSGGVLGARDVGFLSKGLVGYWKGDEAAADTCTGGTNDSCDSSGNGLDGAWNGNATAGIGKYGNAMAFDGANDFVQLAHNAALEPTEELTYAAWFKINSLTGSNVIMAKNNENAGSFRTKRICVVDTTHVCFEAYNGSARNFQGTVPTMNTGTWYHMAATVKDGQFVKIYFNGREVSSTTITEDLLLTDNQNFVIGGVRNGVNVVQDFDGSVDEARVYNRALSSSEVEALYNYTPGPSGYWNFEGKQGSTVSDNSGNGNSATLSNGPQWSRGKYGSGIDFDGSDDVATVTNAVDIDLNTSSGGNTFSAWVYAESDGEGDAGQIYNKGSTTYLRVDSQSGDSLDVEASLDLATTDATVNVSGGIKVGTWNYIAVTYDDDADDEISVYINGVLRGTSTNGVGGAAADANDLLIGGPTTANFDGKIDEFRFYNYSLLPKKITEDMNGGHAAGGSPVGSQLGYWKFDEGYGTTANNSGNAGSAVKCTLTNFSSPSSQTSGWTLAGKIGKALNFDGSDDLVDCGSDSSVDDLSQVTYSVWINPRSIGGGGNGGRIFEKGATNTLLRMSSNNTIRLAEDYNTTDANFDSPNNSIPFNQWTHVIVTYDRSSTSNVPNMYINGKKVTVTVAQAPVGTRVSEASGNLTIGNNTAQNRSFDGWIDEAQVYNYVVSDAEAKVIYNRGSALKFGVLGTDIDGRTASDSAIRRYCPPGDTSTTCAPVGEWRFEEKQGSAANDTSGNGNSGTLTNAPKYASGRIGSSLSFVSASSQSVDVSNTINGVKTVSFWVKPTSATSSMIALTGSAYISASTGTISATGFTSPTIYVNGRVSSILTPNVWQQVIVATGTGINGTAIKFGLANSSYFNGLIDEVKVYNYAFSASQVAWDYNQGKPIAYWKMDECQGSTVYDSSGNGKNGTLTAGSGGTTSIGTCSTGSTIRGDGAVGKFNSSLYFDNNDDYISVPSPNLPTGDFTYTTWVYPASTDTSDVIFSGHTTSGVDELRARIVGTTREFEIKIDSSTTLTTAITIPANTWTHLAVVRSGSTISAYINGVRDANTATDGDTLDFETCEFLIGVDADSGCTTSLPGPFDGKIDDLQIFNYALTAAQIRNVMNQSAAVRFGPATGTP